MIGIYKITNLKNNKVYIGQSSDIYRRWYYYYNPPSNLNYNSAIISAIKKYGVDSFKFEVLEECKAEDLNKKEVYHISKYNSTNPELGYNLTSGGDHNVGESNPRAELTEEDIKFIRTIYDQRGSQTKEEIYNAFFKDKVGFRGFEKAWSGETWTHIYMEVYTQENKDFYLHNAKGRKGELNANAVLTDDEVLEIRERYVKETGKQIYLDYQDKYSSYKNFERVLHGGSYSHLPIYKKREKRWV